MDDDDAAPPPSYAEALRLGNISGSDPRQVHIHGRGGNHEFIPSLEDNLYNVSWGSGSQNNLSRQHEGQARTQLISDSPHSSDDEETAMLKRRVRRVKEEHRLKEENERLRLMVQEMLAQERSRSNSASSSTHRRQEPSVSFNSGSGTIIHPLTTNIPDTSHTSAGRSGMHEPSFPTHWAEPSVQDWNVQQNNSGPTVHPVTTYSPEAPYTGARRSDLHPSYRTQSASPSPETSNTQHAQDFLFSDSTSTGNTSCTTAVAVSCGSTEDEIFGKMCLKCIGTFVGGGLIAFIMIAIFAST